MPRILMHIGAHKTATSYMQKKLALNVDLLARRGIHYEPLDVFRKKFTKLLNLDEPQQNEFLRELVATSKSMSLLISEENILGVPGDLVRKGRQYADARTRLIKACDLLGTNTPEIYLAVREYAGFAVSMYSEYIRHREYIKFSEYLKLYEASDFNWMRVIDDIVAAAPGARMHIWDFANFRKIEKDVFQAMLGFDPDIFENPVGPVRESFSDASIRAFDALSGAMSAEEMRKVFQPIARQFPKGAEYPAFDPLSDEVKASMRDRYKADLAMIAERHPSISFIGGRP